MMNLFLVGFLGGYELVAIGLIILLLFGGKKLPELMKGLGKGIREFNNAKANIEGELKESMKEIDGKSN
ncbi:MAG: twin-arginine translocase TatA/TatE family subunit [Bacteroidota bacterium]